MSTIRIPTDDVPQRIIDLIDNLGIPANLKGYDYLAYGINLVCENLDKDMSMTKDIYPTIAEVYHSTPVRVERSIRNAVERLFDIGDYDYLQNYFGTILLHRDKLSNAQFIYAVARKLHREDIKHS